MSMRRLIAGAAGGLAIALGAGHTGTLHAQRVSANQSADQQFINYVAAENLLEVRLGQAAQNNASNPSVKQFGQRMVDDHTAMQRQWMAAASKNGLEFKADLSSRQVEQFERLNKASGVEFDRAYMPLMVQNHQNAVLAFQNARRVSHGPEIVALIDQDLVALQNHVTLAQQVNSQVLAGGGVATQTDTTTPGANQPIATGTVRADSAFISQVDEGHVTEIRLAQVAESRATDLGVKRYAQKMTQDHNRMRSEWTEVSSKNGLRLSTIMSPHHQAQMTRLASLSGAEFDRAYMSTMVQNHQETISTLENRGRSAQSAEVRQLVSRSIPSVQEHLRLAQENASRIGADFTGDIATGIDTSATAEDRQKDRDRTSQANIKADATWIRDVDQSHTLQIRLGRLAQDRARDGAVKRFGEKMEKDHGELQKQLSNMAARNGMELKSGLGSEHQENFRRIEKLSGREFDRGYMTFMIQSHNGYLNYWRKEGRAARSPAVRQYVNRGLPTLEEDMDQAKRVGRQVGVDPETALQGRRIAADRTDRTSIE
jgi:putative membrane protein